MKLGVPQDGRRKLKGIINGVDNGNLLLAVDDDQLGEQEISVPITSIDKANLIPDI